MELVIALDRDSGMPLYQQVSEELRRAVLQQRLKPSQKLPSSRVFAASLGVSRSTITLSYEQLLSEGYLETRRGSGTFVSAHLPDEYLKTETLEPKPSSSLGFKRLSRLGTELLGIKPLSRSALDYDISFRYANPSTEAFPIHIWRRLLARHCCDSPQRLNYSDDSAGYFPLRAAIADYLGRSRAVQCSAEQVIIVNGSQQALDLMTQLIIDPGDGVALEDPGYLGARYCFQRQGAQLNPLPVDTDGLTVDALDRLPPVKFLYVTPSHQFPTGVTLSLARRLALLQWAQQTGTLILEDDYDSEYRYGDRPIPALQGLDIHHHVMYIESFSKVLFPALRLGYLVVPPT